jgi:hypothetical protein
MNWKNWLSTLGSAFLGGVVSYAMAHITSGIPTTLQQAEAFAGGAFVTGLAAIVHLYQPVPAAAEKK